METVIAILELVGLVLVVVCLFTHKHGGANKKPGGCGCSGTPAVDLSFPNPTGGCS